MPRSPEIFLSHASADIELSRSVCSELEREGFTCWIAPRDVSEGADYAGEIVNAISKSKLLLLVLSAHAAASKHVRRELELAERSSIPIMPIRISKDTSFGTLSYFVNVSQWIDLEGGGKDQNFVKLLDALREQLGPKRKLLSIDGGGPLGIFSLGVLSRIEQLLARQAPDSEAFRLRDYFDLVGGSGTGAMIAAAIAAGKTTREIAEFFLAIAPQVFGHKIHVCQNYEFLSRPTSDQRISSIFQSFFGANTSLGSEELHCFLLFMVRNQGANSPWPITNIPNTKYNSSQRPGSPLHLNLAGLAYASSTWCPGAEVSVATSRRDSYPVSVGDGTFTPYCNPAFLLYQVATLASYRLEWTPSEGRMLLISIGSGQSLSARHNRMSKGSLAKHLPGFLSDSVSDQDLKCRIIGRCIYGPIVDREVGDLVDTNLSLSNSAAGSESNRSFTYVRYDPRSVITSLQRDLHVGFEGYRESRLLDLRSLNELHELSQWALMSGDCVDLDHFQNFSHNPVVSPRVQTASEA